MINFDLVSNLDTLNKISDDIKEGISNDFEVYISNPSKIISHFKSFSIEVLKTSHKIVKQLALYYPKTTLIIFLASIIFTSLSLSLASIITLAIHTYYIYPLKNHIIYAIDVYDKNYISELSSSYENKKGCMFEINAKAIAQNFWDGMSEVFNLYAE